MVRILPMTAGLALTTTTVAAAAAAATTTAPIFNTWPQKNFGSQPNIVDGNVSTYGSIEFHPAGELPGYTARFSFLFNRADPVYAGLYVQSSGDYITDYSVYGYYFGTDAGSGRVCGAQGNFTYVSLLGPDGQPNTFRTDTMFLEVTAAKDDAPAAVINEVWPVWVGDDIFYPNNTSPCPSTEALAKRRARRFG
ncbi:unnamed protein product [Discula destructiva]